MKSFPNPQSIFDDHGLPHVTELFERLVRVVIKEVSLLRGQVVSKPGQSCQDLQLLAPKHCLVQLSNLEQQVEGLPPNPALASLVSSASFCLRMSGCCFANSLRISGVLKAWSRWRGWDSVHGMVDQGQKTARDPGPSQYVKWTVARYVKDTFHLCLNFAISTPN